MALKDHDGFVFIITYGRSGSTVLQKVLQSIEGYFIRGENNHTLFPLYMAYRRAHEARFKHGGTPQGPDNPWYGADAILPANFSQRLCDVFLEEIIKPPKSARIVGFKEIRFHEAGPELFDQYLDFIAAKFPNTKFIFNMRRWEDVSKSSWWATMDPQRVQEILETCDGFYKKYAAKHPGRSLLMQFEDFRGNPDAFVPLFEFLGEPFDRAKIEEVISHKLEHAANVTGGPKESMREIK